MVIKTCNLRSCKFLKDLSIVATANRALVAKQFWIQVDLRRVDMTISKYVYSDITLRSVVPVCHFSFAAKWPPLRNTTIFDLPACTSRPRIHDTLYKTFILRCKPYTVSAMRTISSANSKIDNSIISRCNCIPWPPRRQTSFVTTWMIYENSIGLNIQPCCRPFEQLKYFVVPISLRPQLTTSLYIYFRTANIFPSIPFCSSIFHRAFLLMESKASL